MSAGRIEAYLHSDSVTSNKGGSLVKVLCDTDFGAKTDEFIAFSKKAAQMSYAFSHCVNWTELVNEIPHLEDERKALSKSLKESIVVIIEFVSKLD